jgi:hypothetical protein
MTNTKKSLLIVLMGLSLGACSSMSTTEKRTLTGAGIGAAGGALLGELATGQPLHGAAIGAAAGAVGGWLFDRHEKQ